MEVRADNWQQLALEWFAPEEPEWGELARYIADHERKLGIPWARELLRLEAFFQVEDHVQIITHYDRAFTRIPAVPSWRCGWQTRSTELHERGTRVTIGVEDKMLILEEMHNLSRLSDAEWMEVNPPKLHDKPLPQREVTGFTDLQDEWAGCEAPLCTIGTLTICPLVVRGWPMHSSTLR